MNTKTTKFLSVLAVLAFAFAAFAAATPADAGVAGEADYYSPDSDEADVYSVTGTVATETMTADKAYVTATAGVTFTSLEGAHAATVYVLPGADITVTGIDSVTGITFIASTADEDNKLTATGDSITVTAVNAFKVAVDENGAMTLSGTSATASAVTVGEDSALELSGVTLTIGANTEIAGGLEVTTAASIAGAYTLMVGSLDVDKALTLTDITSLTVSGNADIGANITGEALTAMTIGGTTNISAAATITGAADTAMTFTGLVTMNKDLTFATTAINKVTMTAGLKVAAASTLTGTAATLTIAGDLDVDAAFILATVTGLTVSGNADIGANITGAALTAIAFDGAQATIKVGADITAEAATTLRFSGVLDVVEASEITTEAAEVTINGLLLEEDLTLTGATEVIISGIALVEGKITAETADFALGAGAIYAGDLYLTEGNKVTLATSDDSDIEGAAITGTIYSEDTKTADVNLRAYGNTVDEDALTLTAGSLTIVGAIDGTLAGSMIRGYSEVYVGAASVTGGILEIGGDVTTSGNITLADTTFVVGEAATLTLANETSISSTSDSIILIDGSVVLPSADGTGTIGTSDVIVKMGSTGTLYPTLASTLAAAGVLITDSNMETQYVYDTALGTHDYPANQVLVVDGSWTLADGAVINVSGKLIVPEGSTLTINDGAVLNIIDAAALEVYGKLIVDEPETDTTDGGDLNITNGSMTVYGELTNGGKITVAQDMSVTIAEGGSAKIEDTGVLSTDDGTLFTVESGAALTVIGCIDGASILNYGIVTINSSYAAQSASYIYQMANGAIVYVQLYTINSLYYDTASLTISDEGYHLYTYRNTTTHLPAYVIIDDYNEIEITGALATSAGAAVYSADYNIEVSDLTIVSSSVLKKSTADKTVSTNYYKYMDVAGDIEATYLYVGNDAGISTHVASATVTAAAGTSNASMTVTGGLLVRDYTAFYLSGGSMKVTGNVSTFSTAGSFGMDSDAELTVADDGLIQIYGQAFTDKTGLNATEIIIPTTVSSRTVKVYTYMTVDNALEYLAGESDVVGQANVYGTQTVTETATLYADDVLIVTGTLNIGESNGSSVVLTIKDGATVKGAGYVYVNGTMYAEDKTDVKISDSNISADVKTVELDDKGKIVKNGWAKWTNVLTAISETEDGTVVVTRDATSTTLPAYVYITSNLEIPEGVTLSVPSGAAPLVLYDGVTLTVNGTLIVGATSEVYAQTAFNLIAYKVSSKAFSSAIVVNGSLVTSYEVKYAAGTNATTSNTITNTAGFDALISAGAGGAPIAGAYYQLDGYYVISSLDVAMYSIYDIDTDIVIYGNVTADDVVFTATEYVDNITLSAVNVTYFLLDGGTPTIYNSLKVDSIALYCPSDLTSVALTIATEEYNTFTGTVISSGSQVTVAGAEDVVFTVKPAGTITLTSATAIMVDDSGDAFSIDSGSVTLSAVAITNSAVTPMVIAEGATAKAYSATTSIDYLIVNGTLSVPTTTSLRIDNQIIVNGTLDVASTTASAAKGTFTVADEAMVFIGITADDYTAASNATVSGPVTFTDDAYVMVYSGASVTDEFLGCLGTTSTTFFVEGAAWFTAYKVGTPATTYLTFDEVPVSNAVLDGWASTNGGSRIYFNYSGDYYSYYNLIVGAYSELYAVLDYEIYSVIIMADQGVKNVSIDGVLLKSDATGTDQFVTVADIAAGTHKVTFALYSGHEGTAILQYVDATAGVTATILGMNFTVSGDNAGTVTLQLVGIEESDEPTPEEKSEWTITTILLVILVILIAVMAVIVAIRLNRS